MPPLAVKIVGLLKIEPLLSWRYWRTKMSCVDIRDINITLWKVFYNKKAVWVWWLKLILRLECLKVTGSNTHNLQLCRWWQQGIINVNMGMFTRTDRTQLCADKHVSAAKEWFTGCLCCFIHRLNSCEDRNQLNCNQRAQNMVPSRV